MLTDSRITTRSAVFAAGVLLGGVCLTSTHQQNLNAQVRRTNAIASHTSQDPKPDETPLVDRQARHERKQDDNIRMFRKDIADLRNRIDNLSRAIRKIDNLGSALGRAAQARHRANSDDSDLEDKTDGAFGDLRIRLERLEAKVFPPDR